VSTSTNTKRGRIEYDRNTIREMYQIELADENRVGGRDSSECNSKLTKTPESNNIRPKTRTRIHAHTKHTH
jgi:hypothetical protein